MLKRIKPTVVLLEKHEILMGALAGVQRQVENLGVRNDRFGASRTAGWGLHIVGALGEMALAKYLNLPWTGKGNFGSRDVGRVECRSTTYDDPILKLHKEDDDDARYYLVQVHTTHASGDPMSCRIAGWILGRDGKKPVFWNEGLLRRPCFFVPEVYLNDREVEGEDRTTASKGEV